MANTKITALTELASGGTADGDMVPLVDVSDTTQGASGTLKKFSWGSLKATLKTYFDGLYGPKGPAFSAYLSADQTGIANNTLVKVNFNTESFDTNSTFDTSTSRFTPNVAGYYSIGWNVVTEGTGLTFAYSTLYKNGTVYSYGSILSSISTIAATVGTSLIYLNGTTDYLEVYGYISAASGNKYSSSQFTGNLVRLA